MYGTGLLGRGGSKDDSRRRELSKAVLMGRKKQKVRWTSVEDAGFFDSEQQSSTEATDLEVVNHQQASMRKAMYNGYSNGHAPNMNSNGAQPVSSQSQMPFTHLRMHRHRNSNWSGHGHAHSLPPRFERTKMQMQQNDLELDSNCENEDLPDGFTKIRSKNLDVLFRKDYYAQRMLSTTSSSAVSSEAGEPTPTEEELDVIHLNNEAVAEENEEEILEEEKRELEAEAEKSKVNKSAPSREATPPKSEIVTTTKSKINTNALPFYPSSYMPPCPPVTTTSYAPTAGGVATSTAARPNLFLYSPTSNTMIPCEEIIIPNALMPGQDVYQGPSNIYLAFPMQDGSSSGGVSSGGATSPNGASSVGSGGNSAVSPVTSSNCTPPQAQSPPNTYDYAATPTTTPTMVQYDQYGVPYTTYTPVMPISTVDSGASGTASSATPSSAECSSADSTTTSPPDLSVYNPANWVPDPSFMTASGQHPYQYYPYYPQQQYYNFRNGHASYQQYFIESSNVPSSACESQNEDRSEGEETTTTPNTATTTSSNSPKKEGGVANSTNIGSGKTNADSSKGPVYIPGLPVANLKRPTKKRRKKKNTSLLATVATPILNGSHRGSSSSEASHEKNNVLEAITILEREHKEELVEETAEILDEEKVEEIPEEQEQEAEAEVETEAEAEAEAEEPARLEILVKSEGDDEVLVVEEIKSQEAEEDKVPEVSVKPPRPHRRRRGARKSEKNKKLAAAAAAEAAQEALQASELKTDLQEKEEEEEEEKVEPKPDIVQLDVKNEWEAVPKEISLDPEAGWETATRKGHGATRMRIHVTTPLEPLSREATPPPSLKLSPEPELSTAAPNKTEKQELKVEEQSFEESQSAPVSRKSTLRRTSKKKRASLDGNASDRPLNSGLSRPVLISDRDFDVASAIAAQRRIQGSAIEVLNESRIRDMMKTEIGLDTLYISDIGHGMTGGPLQMGRFGQGKYVPPDRSNEIYPIPHSDAEDCNPNELDENESNGPEDGPKAQKSIIKAMMEEVIRGGSTDNLPNAERLTYIRDAERFSEIKTQQSSTNGSAAEPSSGLPEAILKPANTTELDLD